MAMLNWSNVLEPEVIVFAVPIAAILTGGVIVIVRMVIAHRERMAMIERGIDPREPPEEGQ